MTKDEKNDIKEKVKEIEEKYKIAIIDGKEEEIYKYLNFHLLEDKLEV